jgi:hypothetical protein
MKLSDNFTLNVTKVEKWLFLIEYQLKNLNFVDILKKEIKNKVGSMDYKTNVKGKMTNFTEFVNNEILINILKECTKVTNVLNLPPKSVLKDAWGNILKKGDSVQPHTHDGHTVSGILYLTENGPGTYFKEFNKTIDEKIGKIVLFNGDALHSVPVYNGNEDRYTIAFNFEEMTPWNDIK